MSVCEINQMKPAIKYNNECTHRLGFSDNSESKESACNVGDLGSIPGLGRSPGGGHGNPLQYLCLENPHGQRSLADYSPWGQELDMTDQLSTTQHKTTLGQTKPVPWRNACKPQPESENHSKAKSQKHNSSGGV